jgi:hypothetical protein
MTITILIGTAAFFVGLYAGYRIATSKWELVRYNMEYDYRQIVDHVDDYIMANVHRWGIHVQRDSEGHIVRFITRCGTPSAMLEEFRRAREHYRSLH